MDTPALLSWLTRVLARAGHSLLLLQAASPTSSLLCPQSTNEPEV